MGVHLIGTQFPNAVRAEVIMIKISPFLRLLLISLFFTYRIDENNTDVFYRYTTYYIPNAKIFLNTDTYIIINSKEHFLVFAVVKLFIYTYVLSFFILFLITRRHLAEKMVCSHVDKHFACNTFLKRFELK